MERYDFEFNREPEFRGLREQLTSYEGVMGKTEIEEGVYDAVAVLNMMGIDTQASCGGHNTELVTKLSEEDGFESLGAPGRPFIRLKSPNTKNELSKQKEAIVDLLNEFYSNREVKDPRQKIVAKDVLNGREFIGVTLDCGSSEYKMVREIDNRYAKDAVYRNENMDLLRQEFEDFAKFLYKKWAAGYRFKLSK